MQDIKKRWKPYYDEKKHFLRLEQFVLFEMALMIVNRWKRTPIKAILYLLSTRISERSSMFQRIISSRMPVSVLENSVLKRCGRIR